MQPDSLENKFKLLALLPYDSRARRKHMLVFGFILDWYHRKYGDALASVRHILAEIKERDPSGKGLYSGDVHSALTDLVAWGYLNQEKGSGRRASRYVPIWSKLSSVHKIPNAREDGISVLETPNASVRKPPNATGDSVHKTPNEDPLTPTRVQDPGTGVGGIDCAAPTAPHGAGLEAPAPAGTAQGFDELWLVYDFKREKKKARAEYAKLNPSPEQHRLIIEAARAWKDAWALQGKPDAPRRHLHVWLRDECYDEEPPTAYKPKERKPRKTISGGNRQIEPPTPANDNIPEPWLVRITESDVLSDGLGDQYIQLTIADADVPEIIDRIAITYESSDRLVQDGGQRELSDLCSAIGVDGVEDTTELHGKPFLYERTIFGTHKFYPAAPDEALEA